LISWRYIICLSLNAKGTSAGAAQVIFVQGCATPWTLPLVAHALSKPLSFSSRICNHQPAKAHLELDTYSSAPLGPSREPRLTSLLSTKSWMGAVKIPSSPSIGSLDRRHAGIPQAGRVAISRALAWLAWPANESGPRAVADQDCSSLETIIRAKQQTRSCSPAVFGSTAVLVPLYD
jgi:hypothetical protein